MSEDKQLKLSEELGVEQLEEEDAANYFLAREIHQEILKFGVNQTIILKLIELLALELENRPRMLQIIEATRSEVEDASKESPIIE